MAWRFKLAPDKTNFDFFRWQWLTFGGSLFLSVLAIVAWAVMGLNYGIDFKGGTTIRTESTVAVDVGAYREALQGLPLGDVSITEVFDTNFAENQHVTMIRIAAEDESQAVTPEQIGQVEEVLRAAIDPAMTFPSVESVGPKVSGELVYTSVLALIVTSLCIMVYMWLRFEWQFGVGAVLALLHDVIITIGIFAIFQIKFDLTIVAALLTILGYSINDTVVVFDRLRENLQKYKQMPLREVMNLSVNETLARTLMTALTTLIAVGAMLVFGGDVLRGFSLAIFLGVLFGTYSSVYVAKNIVLIIGLDRSEKAKKAGTPDDFANIDA
ncbi:protein translocase subunit SecF [Rhodobacteraceae bacterium HSP-20]|uniref:Protein-export membrane protein SecF n=1 Tax=Paragemmobacter amnigenus TaxID=2852097 RepID=A0ABS6J6V0_9RHOB|nr:protein translocase subunit SecF [Rhodobacter amnigenus]MBU9699488.1 protein translocase subunit SecF [Rhodobacter amnigenus]MBV4390715.1 protein translocase subunit SecF [Rhodobacter amnigenus]